MNIIIDSECNNERKERVGPFLQLTCFHCIGFGLHPAVHLALLKSYLDLFSCIKRKELIGIQYFTCALSLSSLYGGIQIFVCVADMD